MCNSGAYLESLLARRLPYVFEGLVVLQKVLATSNVHLEETNSSTPAMVKQTTYVEFQVFTLKHPIHSTVLSSD